MQTMRVQVEDERTARSLPAGTRKSRYPISSTASVLRIIPDLTAGVAAAFPRNVTGPDAIVPCGYDIVAEKYLQLEREEWPRLGWLAKLLAALPPASTVLDVGCGAGLPVDRAIVAAGHRVVGIDVSQRQIELARESVPDGSFVACDVRAADFAAASFDAIVSLYAIDHIPRTEHEAVLVTLHQWLRPRGWLLLAIEDGDEPGVVGDWLGAQMFFSHFDAATTLRIAGRVGFEPHESAVEVQVEQGRGVPYLWLLARREELPDASLA